MTDWKTFETDPDNLEATLNWCEERGWQVYQIFQSRTDDFYQVVARKDRDVGSDES